MRTAAPVLALAVLMVLAGPRPAPARQMKATGTGTIISQGDPGCDTSDLGCVVTSSGNAKASRIGAGRWQAAVTIHGTRAFPNGVGGFCAPAQGTASFVGNGLGPVLNVALVGTACALGASGAARLPSTLVAQAIFSNAITPTFPTNGGGTFVSTTDAAGNISFQMTAQVIVP